MAKKLNKEQKRQVSVLAIRRLLRELHGQGWRTRLTRDFEAADMRPACGGNASRPGISVAMYVTKANPERVTVEAHVSAPCGKTKRHYKNVMKLHPARLQDLPAWLEGFYADEEPAGFFTEDSLEAAMAFENEDQARCRYEYAAQPF
jgi:hypothetical protein